MAKTPTKAELIARLDELEAAMMPRSMDTLLDPRNEPHSMLATLTADRVHSAVTSAEQGDTRDLFAIYRDVLIADSHIQGVINTRFLAVIGDDPMIAAANPDRPEDVTAADAIRAAVDRLPDFMGICADLLWGTIWPVAMVERTYRPADVPGLKLDWGEIAPVPDYLFRWSEGYLQLEGFDPVSRKPNGQWSRPDPKRYITHRGHLLRTPDTWGGPMRALMWWFLLKAQDRDWWVRFLDRFGTPFPVAQFSKTDDKSRQILERAFSLAKRIGGLVVSKDTVVTLQQANTSAADAHEKFFRLCNDEISRHVLGQTLSSTASPTGIGSGASDVQGQVRADIAAFDKKMLAQTLRTQLFKPWLRLNGFTGAVPQITWGGEEQEENATTAEVLAKLKSAGLRLADESLGPLGKRIGLVIERDPQPAAAPGPVIPLSAPIPRRRDPVAAAHSISREAAASIMQAYRGSLAPVAQIILDSPSPEVAQTRLLATYVHWDASKVAELVESALVAGAWNGAVN